MHQKRLSHLRQVLKERGYEGFLFPMADKFQNEYVPASENRIEWLSGFTGSAGFLVVTEKKAALFVDSRYTEQAQTQVDQTLFDLLPLSKNAQLEWLKENLSGKTVAFDPWLHTIHEIQFLEKDLRTLGIDLKPDAENPVDAIWHDRPTPPQEPAFLHEAEHCGHTVAEKAQKLVQNLQILAQKAQNPPRNINFSAFIGDVTASNWLLNMRGADLPNTPVFLNFCFIDVHGNITVFTTLDQIPLPLRAHLRDQVTFCDWADLEGFLGQQAAVYLPLRQTPYALLALLIKKEGRFILGEDFYSLEKAQKNATELKGAREAHLIDGLAVTRFLYTLQTSPHRSTLTESTAADLLEEMRQKNNTYRCPSFPTISAVGAHAALPHYRHSEASNASLKEGEVYLVDSGGQYPFGTTDITRTLFLGDTPSEDLKKHFTLVLKGHIALSCVQFPKGTTGAQLDVLARHYLWQEGLTFGHGTGHGVGHFLNVHEGPQSISPNVHNTTPLLEGMILSNEPGYYLPGAYGIRIENLMCVRESQEQPGFLYFETLTLAPIDRTLIDQCLLTPQEKTWLNTYHQRVFEAHAAFLGPAERAWLKAATTAL